MRNNSDNTLKNTLKNNLADFLEEQKIDYLLVNSTNEFLLEYNKLEDCARYHLTGFRGSTGRALMSREDVFLFVDGRYHEQADKEANIFVNVVKLKMGETLSSAIEKIVPEGATLAIVSKKTSKKFFDNLKSAMPNRKFVILDFDPVMKNIGQTKKEPQTIEEVPLKICGVSSFDKFKKIAKDLKENEAILTTTLEDIAYFLNMRSYSFPFFSGFEAKMIIEKTKVSVFCDNKLPKLSELNKEFKIFSLAEFEKYISKSNLKFQLEPSHISLFDYQKIKNPINVKTGVISKMKAIKNDSEIEYLKNCYKRHNLAVKNFKKNLVEGVNEFGLSNLLESEFKKHGAKALSFKTIMAGGKNSSVIHYSYPSPYKKLQNGDLVLVDCGAYFEGGYATDFTRTFVIGTPSKLQKEVYTTVLKAFLNAYHSKTERGSDLDKIARDLCRYEGFDFPHGTGHGTGILVHEAPPVISPNYPQKLEKNMVFSIEPGLYKTGDFGVRLESVVYYTDKGGKGNKGFECLGKFEFEEKLIERNMLTKKEEKWLDEWQNSSK